MWGFDCGVVYVFTLPVCCMIWIGSLFLTFWYKVDVPSSRAQQAINSVSVVKGWQESLCGPMLELSWLW